MGKIQLCLLDCTSIQRFVFGSNKLKTNIGASQIVADVYEKSIPTALIDIGLKDVPQRFENWKNDQTGVIELLVNNSQFLWETGYVGGGSALLLFRDNLAEKFVATWTRKLLLDAPSLRPAVAIWNPEINTTSGDISKEVLEELFSKHLTRNKNRYIPETNILPQGITAECPVSGLSAEVYDKTSKRWISAIVKNKIELSDEASIRLHKKFKNALKWQKAKTGITYRFSDDLENLGQSYQEANHLGIVHIDGNSMGQAFKNCSGLIERRQLSKRVDNAVFNSMEVTIKALIDKLSVDNKSGLRDILKFKNNENDLLPFRPIIVNGDDITFICDARISFFLAETFMRAFASEKACIRDSEGNETEQNLSSCAGIAISKTKYPFYRGYMLAEQLCARAKEEGRKNNSSWLDFHISYRGLSESLEEMRKQQYLFDDLSLIHRPWQITETATKNSFGELKKALKSMRDDEGTQWPRSKWHELAATLTQGIEATQEFLKLVNARNLHLPPIAQITGAAATGWAGKVTPYFDVLEIMDFYPKCLLDEEEK